MHRQMILSMCLSNKKVIYKHIWNSYVSAADSVASIVCIPTATTVKVTVMEGQDDDIIHVYKT